MQVSQSIVEILCTQRTVHVKQGKYASRKLDESDGEQLDQPFKKNAHHKLELPKNVMFLQKFEKKIIHK